MLINLRNALMAGKRLPYDAEVEYLESTGTQYIDTGVVPTTTKAEITFSTPTPPASGYMCGSFNANNRYYPVAYAARRILIINAVNTTIASFTNDGGIHTIVYNAAGGACYFDGVAAGTLSTTTLTASNPIYLFGTSTATGVSGRVSGRVYSLKIYDENGTLVRDFIPVRVGTVGYLYDRVSGKLFGNAGTGDFVLGADVVPVEYIESHGTEYIDTGVTARTGLATDIVCAITQAQNDTAVCGAKGTSNNRCVPVAFFSSDSTTALVYGNGNRDTDSIYAQYYPEVGRMVRYQSEISTGAISLNIDGTAYTRTTQTSTINAGTTLRMFAREWNGAINAYSNIRIASALFDLDGERVRSFLPVRVGTEGAMMDVLTRRVYRNAGTGAFTYGNDLKYPIPSE